MNYELLKECAWEKFPAQELWVKKEKFWAFENKEDSDKVYLTSGYIQDEEIKFDTIFITVSNKNRFITQMCESKRKEGYECIAIQMRE